MTQIMVYVLPMLMYFMSLLSEEHVLRVTWAILSSFQILNIFTLITHIACCALVSFYIYLPSQYKQYSIKVDNTPLPQSQTYNIVMLSFALMCLLLNVYSNPHPKYKQNADK